MGTQHTTPLLDQQAKILLFSKSALEIVDYCTKWQMSPTRVAFRVIDPGPAAPTGSEAPLMNYGLMTRHA